MKFLHSQKKSLPGCSLPSMFWILNARIAYLERTGRQRHTEKLEEAGGLARFSVHPAPSPVCFLLALLAFSFACVEKKRACEQFKLRPA